MAKIGRFEDLFIWQHAFPLFKKIQELSIQLDLRKEFAIGKQAKSSAGSIMDNIAEGFDRTGNREFVNFLSIARASSSELRSQIFRIQVILDLPAEEVNELFEMQGKISSGCIHLIRRLKISDYKGYKFS